MKLATLRISIAINVLLVGAIIALGWHAMSVRDDSGADVGQMARFAATGPEPLANAATLKEVNAKLLACGFAPSQAKQLVLASLPRSPAPAFEYWRPALVRQLSERLAEYDARQAQRGALIAAFGSSAADEPEFAEVFFPFAERWSYLPARLQVALEAKLADEHRSRLVALREPGTAALPEPRTGVEGVLGIEGAREYNIRESLLAQSLSNIGFNFSEQEFRTVLSILAEEGGGEGRAVAARLDPMRMSNEHDPTTARIKEALGEQRFSEYRKSQDPKYRLLLAVGEMYGIAKANLDKAYQIDSDNASKVALMMKQGPVLSAESRRTIEGLRATRSTQMRELLGEEATAFYTRSTAAFGGASAATPMGAPIMVRPRSN